MDDIIDSVIAESNAVEHTEEKTAAPETENNEKVADPKKPVDSDQNEKAEVEKDIPFPKKAERAIERRNKQLSKLREELAALKAAQQPAQQLPKQTVKSSDGPNEDDYENYGDYLVAKAKHELKQEMALEKSESQKQQADLQRQNWVAQREEVIVSTMETHKTNIPDFAQVIAENADIADEFPDHIAQAFYEADDAGLAFYNLAKEGKLEALANMSPYRAAMEIAKAEQKKPTLNKVSSAPQPISGATGTARTARGWDQMSGEEIIKKLGIKA